MKKVIALSLAFILGVASIAAAGPLMGIQLEPTVGTAANFLVGWDFGYGQINLMKTDLASWAGDWAVSALWTPTSEGFVYKAGIGLELEWTGALVYNGLSIILGAEKRLGAAFGVYGNLWATSTGVIRPVLGVNFYFDALAPVDCAE